jgi:hypothetical protein
LGVSERADHLAVIARQRFATFCLSTPGTSGAGLDQLRRAAANSFNLHHARRTDPKVIADQQGHGLGVHIGDYVESPVAKKREAASALWEDFKVLASASSNS